MMTINHECYTSLEVAKLLKKAGFDWECETCYIGKSKRPYKYHKYFNWNMPRKYFEKEGSDNLFHAFINQKKTCDFISAQTLDVAQRWLRDVMDIDVYIFPDTNVKRECVYQVGIKTFGRTLWIPGQPSTAQYDTYEEAQEVGIKKALELILEKGK